MTSPGPRIPTPTAAQRLRLVKQRWPAAAQLARVLSLAVRIEPALLRATRLAAGLDAAAEADLWFSGIIASTGTLGISFVPAVAEALRRELAASPDERELAWKLIKEYHGQQPWSIRLEERINYLTTGPPDEASEVEDLLAAALSELHEVRARDEQAALGIARWLLAALARAPEAARATPTAAAAELAAGVHLDGRLGGTDQLARAEDSELLPWLLDHLGTTVLPVRLLPGAVAFGGDPPDGIPLPVPATDPLAVSVIWGSGSGAHLEHVRVPPGEELEIPVEATEVELRTLAGGGVVLRRAGIGRIMVNGVDRGAGFAVADYAILTAAHVLGDEALRSSLLEDPAGSLASEAPAVEADSSEDADTGSSASGPAPDVIYIPEDGERLNVRVVATDSKLDVTLLKPERPAPAILPVGQIQPGQKWRLQVPPGRDQTGSRQGVGAPAVSFGGVTTSGDPHTAFALNPQLGRGPTLPGQSGAAITLENPWGAVIGLLLAETTQVVEGQFTEQLEARELTTRGIKALLRVASIDAIVTSFNLARQITPATAALVDGKWPKTQPLEDLVTLPLRDGILPLVSDVGPTQLGLSPGRRATAISPTLQSALRTGAFVLFAGDAHAPSWAAYEVLRAELPGARLLVPSQRAGTLAALATHHELADYREQVVVWLDDLPRYLNEEGGLDPLVLSRFERQHHQTVLIGTISEADLDRLRSDAPQPGPIQRLLDQAVVINLVEERETPSEGRVNYPDPRQALARRLRALREEHWPGRKVKQDQLALALSGDDRRRVSVPLISSWESQTNPKVPPASRIEDIATFYASPRSFDGRVGRLLDPDEMTAQERAARQELLQELMSLRNNALAASGAEVDLNAKPPLQDDEARARAAAGESERLRNAGRATEALASMQEAVNIYRSLSAAGPEHYLPDLGRSLSGLSSLFSALGRHTEALPAAEEAVNIFRTATVADPSRHRPDLAMSLNNLSNRLSELGRREEALPAIEEAVALYRELAAARPDEFRPDLAMSLNNLSTRLSELGRREEALTASQEADDAASPVGHVFISYVREDSRQVDQLQQVFETAGVRVWRDTADLWPGEDWRGKIRRAITDNSLVFVVCFSRASLARGKSYQNEELTLAIEQLRLRRPDDPWLIPVRFDDCDIPDRDIGGGRTLTSIQRVDLFGNRFNEGAARLTTAVLRILGRQAGLP